VSTVTPRFDGAEDGPLPELELLLPELDELDAAPLELPEELPLGLPEDEAAVPPLDPPLDDPCVPPLPDPLLDPAPAPVPCQCPAGKSVPSPQARARMATETRAARRGRSVRMCHGCAIPAPACLLLKSLMFELGMRVTALKGWRASDPESRLS
jgi:hypothetical protein